MKKYSAKLQFATTATKLADFIFSPGTRPAPDFVVGRHVDGSTASVFSDDAWNLTAYHASLRTSWLYFNCWEGALIEHQRALMEEAKWIIFIHIFMKRGQPLSFGTLYNHLKTLKYLMRYCAANSGSLSSVLGDADLLKGLCSGENAGKIGCLNVMLRNLYDLGTDVVGFEVLGTGATKELRAMFREYSASLKQHAPIPTRIYSHIISALTELLDGFEANAERILVLAEAQIANPGIWRVVGSRTRELGLVDYFESRGFFEPTTHSLSSLISETLYAAALQVQLFTGMRGDELRKLPYSCLTEETRDGRVHYIVKGWTTKLNHGRQKVARWVTSDRGRKAILLAQRISKVMYGGNPPPDAYLFVNTMLGDNTGKGKQPLNWSLRIYSRLKALLCIPITDADLAELENIDPHRAWQSEDKYQLGALWPLSGHQFRRSLALYAQRSGLVTLPTLKRQLQHITEEMSRYYARGSAFANDFIGKQKDHIGTEWRETQPISQYLGYAAAVIFSDEELFGGHGNWVKHRLKDGDIILHDREVTLERFKKGLVAFRETAIGGCVNTKECDSGVLDLLDLACLKKGCKNLVGSPKKLDRAIAVQRKRVEALKSLSPTSPEYRSELSDLDVLLSVKMGLASTPSGANQ